MLEYLPITDILDPRKPIRVVNKLSVEYYELVDSIRKDGILQPILVRPYKGTHEAVEGAHRLAAAKEAGLSELPCLIREMDDTEVSLIQLKAQALRPKMIDADYAARLQEIIDGGVVTLAELSAVIGKSAAWIRKIIKLNDLTVEVKTMVNRGEITIGNAAKMCMLPKTLQLQFVEQAAVLNNYEFKELIRTVLKNYREMIKKGRIDNTLLRMMDPMPHLRSMTDLREEVKNWHQAGVMIKLMKAETALDGWRSCLRWLLHLDPTSLQQHEERSIKARAEKLNAIERRTQDKKLKQSLMEKPNG